MKCLACGKEIGFFRQLRDTEFCSNRCRRRGERPSAMALRDTDESLVSPTAVLEESQPRRAKPHPPVGVILILSAMLVVLVVLGGNDNGAPAASNGVDETTTVSVPGDGFFTQLWSRMTEKPVVRLRDDFRSGFNGWMAADGDVLRASQKAHALRTGDLVLWKPSLKFVDYRFEFEGQVDKKAISWVYRSPNAESYYSTKLVSTTEGTPNQAMLIRSVVIGAKTLERTELPIPMRVVADHAYRIAVEASGSKFVTTVDGHVVDQWQDIRLHYGGVGFFADAGEAATVHWARIVQSENRFSSLFAGFLVAPTDSNIIPLF